ncbi:SIR2 family protein [Cyclobacterium qasimii]|uniref:Uncharacterized protein n=2 Tax=Cyclobacterium qasimii TaxID=1350429 RepID=S7VG83_9BACT|nr:SIR2 family protein [Cyclobacterium qasimii]EPR69026.1 hypothetical protein ADICYQ_1946 [Cyclobacterium qasimii M12-11B]GEO22238.1 hypothetical protein CQA01_27720 [Cyclobacterium qasimii]
MNKNNNVFLFGAGAMIDWAGPTTQELTEQIRKEGFKVSNSEQKLTDYIYEQLIKVYDKDDVNFETIINVIEELSVYYSEFKKGKQSPSLLRSFINDLEFEKLFDYSIKGGKRKTNYKLQIPRGQDYDSARHAFNNENPNQFYLQHELSCLLTSIVYRIFDYAFHNSTLSEIKKDSEISINFKKWISTLEKNNAIRMYSLNYDRIFKVLLNDVSIDCFDGFEMNENESDSQEFKCDISRILEDQNSNIFYNLHGSAYWKVDNRNRRINSPEILSTNMPQLQGNYNISNIQIERGKPILISNIITGFQKAQKTMIPPFKQMHFAFDRDCFKTNIIYIIGYSFSDEHINQCIKTALRHRQDLSLVIVDPSFIEKNLDQKLNRTIFTYIENCSASPKILGSNMYSYYYNRVIVYTLKFCDYLIMKNKE